MTTLRFNAPDGFKREFLEDGTIRATCEYCQAVLIGTTAATGASQSQHRLTCAVGLGTEITKADSAGQGNKK